MKLLAEEYRILDSVSVNYELVTYTLADWASLFEARFFLWSSIFGSAPRR